MFIYKVTNNVTNKIYIGQTIRKPEERWRKHGNKRDRGLFAKSIRKHGKENFTLEIIACAFTREYLDELEQYFIKKYDSLVPNGYNLDSGGCLNKTHSKETREKISRGNKGRIPWTQGKHHSEETKLKMSASAKGKNTWVKGTKRSEEFKNKMSKLKMGHVGAGRRKVKAINILTGEIRYYDYLLQAEQQDGFVVTNICQVLKGKRKTHYGFKWEYC